MSARRTGQELNSDLVQLAPEQPAIFDAAALETLAAIKAERAAALLRDGKRYLAREALREAVDFLNEAEVDG